MHRRGRPARRPGVPARSRPRAAARPMCAQEACSASSTRATPRRRACRERRAGARDSVGAPRGRRLPPRPGARGQPPPRGPVDADAEDQVARLADDALGRLGKGEVVDPAPGTRRARGSNPPPSGAARSATATGVSWRREAGGIPSWCPDLCARHNSDFTSWPAATALRLCAAPPSRKTREQGSCTRLRLRSARSPARRRRRRRHGRPLHRLVPPGAGRRGDRARPRRRGRRLVLGQRRLADARHRHPAARSRRCSSTACAPSSAPARPSTCRRARTPTSCGSSPGSRGTAP